MLFRKKGTKNLTKGGPLSEIAWDEKTVKWIAQRDRFVVDITHIRRTISLGDNDYGDRIEGTDCEVHGVMYDLPGVTYPKFIPVRITFEKENTQFGGFSYQTSDTQPLLEVWLPDRDEQKAQLLIGALRDAILSGRKYACVRFFKKEAKG
jgi:hypothetical protein